MESFDELYDWLSCASVSNIDPTAHRPFAATLAKRSMPYLQIMGFRLEQVGEERVRGVRSKIYEARDESNRLLFTHSTARQHVAFLAKNILKMLAGEDPDSMSITYDRP